MWRRYTGEMIIVLRSIYLEYHTSPASFVGGATETFLRVYRSKRRLDILLM